MSEIVLTGVTGKLAEELTKANRRIKELESAMQEFVDYASEHSLIGQTKRWKEKFKDLLK